YCSRLRGDLICCSHSKSPCYTHVPQGRSTKCWRTHHSPQSCALASLSLTLKRESCADRAYVSSCRSSHSRFLQSFCSTRTRSSRGKSFVLRFGLRIPLSISTTA